MHAHTGRPVGADENVEHHLDLGFKLFRVPAASESRWLESNTPEPSGLESETRYSGGARSEILA